MKFLNSVHLLNLVSTFLIFLIAFKKLYFIFILIIEKNRFL